MGRSGARDRARRRGEAYGGTDALGAWASGTDATGAEWDSALPAGGLWADGLCGGLGTARPTVLAAFGRLECF